jgi:autoinducer 2 (AI-2) kinase
MSFVPAVNWQRVIRCIGKALGEAGIAGDRIRAVSLTSMREVDRALRWRRPRGLACANVDSRAEAEVRELKAQADAWSEFYEESGQTFALGACPHELGTQTPPRGLRAGPRSLHAQ